MLLKVGYFSLSLLMFFVLLYIAKYAIAKTYEDSASQKIRFRKVIFYLCLWHLYIFGMSQTGFLQNLDLPPRFATFLIIPAFIFIGVFAYQNRQSKWLQSIPPTWLIFYQSFRVLIELLFVASIAKGIVHKNITIEGYKYDMVFGFSALIVGALFLKKYISPRMVLAWNFLGLVVIAFIIFLVNATIYTPHIFGEGTAPFSLDFIQYPYLLIPGFLMPSAVFIHVLFITQYLNRE